MSRISLFLLVTLLLMAVPGLHAQTPEWMWVAQAGSFGSNTASSIALDSAGNTYITGWFYYQAVFGSTTLISAGDWDIFIAKLSPSGNWLWAKRAGASNEDQGLGISCDAAGNCYVTGRFRGNAAFGSITLSGNNINYDDIFVCKLDTNGNFLWAKMAAGDVTDIGNGIATSSNGTSVVTGSYYGSVAFGGTTLVSSGSSDLFAASLDTAGNWLWASSAGNPSYWDYGYAIALDAAGNSFVTGSFYYTASFGSVSITAPGESSDAFIAKLDAWGNWLWAKRAGGNTEDSGLGVATDAAGRAYVSGYFTGSAEYGTQTLTSLGVTDLFVACLDSDGNWLWSTSAGGSSYDWCWGIATNVAGRSLITGQFEGTAHISSTTLTAYDYGDVFVAKLDENGAWMWARHDGGPAWDIGKSIKVDNQGNSYIAGSFGDAVSFGSINLTSVSSDDVFAAKLSSDGTPVCDEIVPPAVQCVLGRIYPNPCPTGIPVCVAVNLPDRKTGTIGLYNLRGQPVREYQLRSGNQDVFFETTDLPAGIYLLSLSGSGMSSAKKLAIY